MEPTAQQEAEYAAAMRTWSASPDVPARAVSAILHCLLAVGWPEVTIEHVCTTVLLAGVPPATLRDGLRLFEAECEAARAAG